MSDLVLQHDTHCPHTHCEDWLLWEHIVRIGDNVCPMGPEMDGTLFPPIPGIYLSLYLFHWSLYHCSLYRPPAFSFFHLSLSALESSCLQMLTELGNRDFTKLMVSKWFRSINRFKKIYIFFENREVFCKMAVLVSKSVIFHIPSVHYNQGL
jgi:hypothetical protein